MLVVAPLRGRAALGQLWSKLQPSWTVQHSVPGKGASFEPYNCLPEGDNVPISLLRKLKTKLCPVPGSRMDNGRLMFHQRRLARGHLPKDGNVPKG